MSWIITRPINGISINGDECVCGSDDTACKFNSIAEAKEFLAKNGYTEMEIEDEGINFVETNEDRKIKCRKLLKRYWLNRKRLPRLSKSQMSSEHYRRRLAEWWKFSTRSKITSR